MRPMKKARMPKDLNQNAKATLDAVIAKSEAAPLKRMQFRRFAPTPIEKIGTITYTSPEQEMRTVPE